MTECNSAFGEIVGGEFQSDFVAREHADSIASQSARQMGQDYAFVFELYAKQTAGEFFYDSAGDFNAVFFTHCPPMADYNPGSSKVLPEFMGWRGTNTATCS